MQVTRRLSLLGLLAYLLPGLALALQPGTATEATGEDWNIGLLMDELASQRSEAGEAGEAQFTEIKTLASLKEPLTAKGVLRYRFPSTLEKEVLKPRAERYVINGESMEIYRDGKLRRQVRLADHPALQNFVRSFIATMGGDLEALRAHYSLRLEGERSGWTLHLTPIDTALQEVVKHITVRGQDSSITSFETLQPNDDSSLMLITPQG